MGGSTDAFALYLSLFQVSRPTDPSKPTTSLSFHKEAESKFEFGTSTLKPDEKLPIQEELLSYEDVKAGVDREKEKQEEMETTQVQANPIARGGRRLGGDDMEGQDEGEGKEGEGEGEGEQKKPSMRELAVRAAEKRAQQQADEVEGLKARKVEEVQGRAQPVA